MPTPCLCCGKTFDLLDGVTSQKFYPNNVICESCSNIEKEEIDLCENFTNAVEWISNNRYDLDEIIEVIYQVQHYRRFSWTTTFDFKGAIDKLAEIKTQLTMIEEVMKKVNVYLDQ